MRREAFAATPRAPAPTQTERRRQQAEDDLSEEYGALLAAILVAIPAALAAAGIATLTLAAVTTVIGLPLGVIALSISATARRIAAGETSRQSGEQVSILAIDDGFARELSRFIVDSVNHDLDGAVNAVTAQFGDDLNALDVKEALARELAPDASRWRSNVEAVGAQAATSAFGKGALVAAEKLTQRTGQQHALRWRSRRDGRVRPSHRIADGQTRVPGARFSVGGQPLLFPGDLSCGCPDQTQNCRCTLDLVRT